MCSNLHMPETPPSTGPASLPTVCHGLHGQATRIVEWHEPDRHSATGDETYGPFYLLVCGADTCLVAAIDKAHDEGGVRVDHYQMSYSDIVGLVMEAAA